MRTASVSTRAAPIALGGRLERVVLHVGEHHVQPGGGESLGQREPDAAARPGDDGDLTVDQFHAGRGRAGGDRGGGARYAWFSPPKISLTLVSSNTAASASARMRATDSTSILSICFSGSSGKRVGEDDPTDVGVLQPIDRRAGEHAVRGHRPHLGGAAGEQELGGGHDRAAGVDHVVGEDALAAADLADHVERLGDVVHALRPPLVDEGEVGVDVLGHALGDLDPAGVGGHDHRVDGVLS